MDRRRFIGSIAAAGAGTAAWPAGVVTGAAPPREAVETPIYAASQAAARSMQRLHADAQTDPAGVEYFFVGNGRVVAAIQHATGEALAMGQTPLGLLLWDPHQFARKWSTFTFHPEWGLARGMIAVRAGEDHYRLDPATLTVERTYPDGVPVVLARWAAGPYAVEERYWVDAEAPLLVREVSLANPTADPVPVAFITTLYANHILFTDHRADRWSGALRADGHAHVELFTDGEATVDQRYITAEAGTAARGVPARTRFYYVIRTDREAVMGVPAAARWESARDYWAGFNDVETPEPQVDDLFRAARDGLRATVSEAGRFDASVWQYNMEWTMDATGVLQAALRTGQFDLAASVLDNIVTRLVDDRGICAHSSRFRDNMATELNQQGALLGSAWLYWAWTGDLDRIRRHWPKLRKVAEFPLSKPYLHESGLIQAGIELFERDESAGVEVGFDVTHQSSVSWGLEKAALLAERLGDARDAARWAEAGRRMREAMLNHPRLALVDDGVLIKRRLPDGRRQRTLTPPEVGTDHIPADSPLARERDRLLDPDVGILWPLYLKQLSLDDPLAVRTLDAVRTLWREEGGGYLRYHPSSEPDAPGGWTFPTAIVGQVLARAGHAGEVRRVLDWFTSVQGARGGSYFEIYSDASRAVPPLPPLGVIVWGWAEIASLFVDGLAGVAPDETGEALRVAPHLPSGMDALDAVVRHRGHRLTLRVRRGAPGTEQGAVLDGRSVAFGPDGVALPALDRDRRLEVTLS